MIQTSEQINELAGALAAAQGEVENAAKNAANPHFKSRYADLAELLNTLRPVLAAHGLAVVQMPAFEGGIVSVETMLTHKSGQWLRGTIAAPVTKADPQGVGSAVTYLRRYSLAAVCGIAQEDDDGNAASAKPQGRGGQRQERAEEPMTEKQREFIGNLLNSSALTDEERAKVQKRLAGGMTKQSASKCADWLRTTIEGRKAAA